MTTRYVHSKNGRASGSFDTQSTPARSINKALSVAKAGDTIEILDAATYYEDEILIDKPLTIVSSFILANPDSDPTDPQFNSKKFPEITVKSGAKHRVLRIAGTLETRASAGPVVVKGVRITGGHSVHSANEPALGAGGGIAVVEIDNVSIERCIISGNRTEIAPVNPWPESDRLAIRSAVVGIVGEIITPGSEELINNLIKNANPLLKRIQLPPLSPLNRTAILINIGKSFDKHLSPGRPNAWLAGQAFGGGVAAVWASPTISRCLIRENTAQGRGAGFAVVGYGWPTLEKCCIDNNRSDKEKGRRDGGGVGCQNSLPGKMTRNLSEIDLVKFLTGKVSDVKSIIGSPLSHITIWDIIDFVRWLANPFQPSPPFKGIKAVILDLIGGRFDSALDHLLYFFASSALSRFKFEAWNQDEIEMAQKKSSTFNECRLSKNWCADDGGGFYASVLSRVHISKTKIVNNTAIGSGGGARLSMGSAGEIIDCELNGNTAIVNDPKKELTAGGGGLSARNVDIILTNTRIGSTPGISRDSNVCSDHAGGGFAFQSDTEGNLAGFPDLWTAIMVEVFGVRKVEVLIKADCAITGNGAGFDERRNKLSKTLKAKGGGIWLLQGEFPDAPHVNLCIEAVSVTVRGNTAQTKGYDSKVEPGTKIATANEICIQDFIGRKEWTESNFGRLVAGGNLNFAP